MWSLCLWYRLGTIRTNVKPIVVRSATQRLNRKAGRVMRSRPCFHHHQPPPPPGASQPAGGRWTAARGNRDSYHDATEPAATVFTSSAYEVVSTCVRGRVQVHACLVGSASSAAKQASNVSLGALSEAKTQTAGPTCPNKRVADWQNVLSTLQIRSRSFKAPDSAWHGLFGW